MAEQKVWITKEKKVAIAESSKPILRSPFHAERVKELEQALDLIKMAVCGDAYPRWSDALAVTHSRGRIADICDAALQPHLTK
jgi:hypothetical protein